MRGEGRGRVYSRLRERGEGIKKFLTLSIHNILVTVYLHIFILFISFYFTYLNYISIS